MSERSLWSYLLLPRPGDLIKAWIFPAAFAVGVLAARGIGGRELLRAAVVWVALELLIYQARYQWNDIRGFAADQRHPDRRARGRLPGPFSRGREHIRISRSVALARLSAVALLAFALPPLDLYSPLLALTVAVFGVACLYEVLRARATGAGEGVPPAPRFGIVALWVAVGAGYAIRGVAGLSLAVDVFTRPGLLVSTVVAFWAFGIAFVTGRWALEALAFASCDRFGRIRWRVEPGHDREHQLALTRWLPNLPSGSQRVSEDGGLSDWRALRDGAPLLSPWNLAAVAAAAAATLSGWLLAGQAGVSEASLAAAGALCALAVLALSRRQWLGLVLGGLVLAALFASAGSPRPALAVLPWLCFLGAHLFFASQSPRTLSHPVRSAIRTASLSLTRPPPPRRQHTMAPLPRR